MAVDGTALLNKAATFPVQNITPFSASEVQLAFADFGGNVSFTDGDSGIVGRVTFRIKQGATGASAVTIAAATDNKGTSYTLTAGGVTVGGGGYIVQDKVANINENSGSFTFSNVLADASAAGTITAVTQPVAGAGSVAFNGSAETITYTLPDGDFNGAVNFSYTAEDAGGSVAVGNVTVTVNAVNDKPQITDPGAQQVAEDAADNFVILQSLTITDVENDTVSLAITDGNADGIFAIDNTGRLIVVDNTNLDFETTPQYTLEITATDDGADPSDPDTVIDIVINVTDVAEGAQVSVGSANGVPGDIVSVDVSLQLTPAESPIIQFNTNITFDASKLELLLDDSTDGNSDGFDDIFNIPVTANGTQLLNKAGTFPVQNVTPLSASQVQFAFADFGGNVSFTDGDNGVIGRVTFRIKQGATGALSVMVTSATDNNGATYSFAHGNVTIGQEEFSTRDRDTTIDENSGDFTFTNVLADAGAGGNLTGVTQPPQGEGTVTFDAQNESITYTLPDGDFNGVVNFTYTAEDAGGTSSTSNVTITVTAINDKPQIADPGTQQVAENAADNFVILQGLTITDVENDTVSLAITSGNADGIFAIDNTGRLIVVDNTNLDFETTPQYVLEVTATDDGPNPSDPDTVIDIVINVTDVNEEEPTISLGAVTGNTNDLVTVNVRLDITEAESPIIQFNTNIAFDSNKLELLLDNSADANNDGFDDVFGFPVTANGTQLLNKADTFPTKNVTPFSASQVQLAFADFSGNISFSDSDSGVIGRLVFRIKQTPSSDSPVTPISGVDNRGTDYTLINGNVTIIETYNVANKATAINENTDSFTFTNVLNDASGPGTITAVTQPPQDQGTVTFDGQSETITYTLPDGDFNGVVVFTYTAEDAANRDDVGTVTVTVNPVNDRPVVTNPGVLSVPEDAENNDIIIQGLTITDVENDTPTLSITGGNDDGIFGLNAATGQIVVVDNTNLDFETTPQYTLEVTATDDGTDPSEPDTITDIVINVVDVVEGLPTVGLNSASGNPTQVVSVSLSLSISFAESPITQFTTDVGFDGNKLELLLDASMDGNSDGFDDTFGLRVVPNGTRFVNHPLNFPAMTITPQANSVQFFFDDPGATTTFTDADNGIIADLVFAIRDGSAAGSSMLNVVNSADNRGTTYVQNGGAVTIGTGFMTQPQATTIDENAGGFTFDSVLADASNGFGGFAQANIIDITQPNAGEGTATFDTNSITYTSPNSDFNGNVLFTYTSEDNFGVMDTQTVTVTITPINDKPTITIPNAQTVAENAQNTDVILNNLTVVDVENDNVTLFISGGNDDGIFGLDSPSGQISIVDNSNLDFETTPQYNLEITATDDGPNPSEPDTSITVTINVTNVNDTAPAPLQVDDVTQNTVGQITFPLAGFTDDDDPELDDGGYEYRIVQPLRQLSPDQVLGDGETLTIDNVADGTVTFEPGTSLTGTYDFTYDVFDGVQASSARRVIINLAQLFNVEPKAATTAENSGSVTINDVLDDATDENGQAATGVIVGVTQPASGTALFDAAAETLTFTLPDGDFNGVVNFTYTAEDAQGNASTNTVTITVTAVNDKPVITDPGVQTVSEDAQNTAVVLNELTVDDVENDNITLSITGGNDDGTFGLDSPSGRIFVLDNSSLDFETTPQYVLQITATDDGSDPSDPDTTLDVVINVTNVNDNAPTLLQIGDVTQLANGLLNFNLAGFTDIDDPQLVANTYQYRLVQGLQKLTPDQVLGDGETLVITNAAAGTIAFNPGTAETGTYDFTYDVFDGVQASTTRRVIISLAQLFNVHPRVATLDEGAGSVTIGGILIDATDDTGSTVDGTLVAVTQPPQGQGTATFNAQEETITYTLPDDDFNGQVIVTYTAEDDEGNQSSNTITITINPVNDRPSITAPGVQQVAEDAANNTTVLNGITTTDVENDTVTLSIVSGNEDNIFAIDSPSGRIFVADNANLDFESRQSYLLLLRATDDGPESPDPAQTVSVEITVVNVNDNAPVLNQNGDVNQFVLVGEVSHFSLLGYSDADDPELNDGTYQYRIVQPLRQLTPDQVIDNGETLQFTNVVAGTMSFDPGVAGAGTYDMTYDVFDGVSASTPRRVIFDLIDNEPPDLTVTVTPDGEINEHDLITIHVEATDDGHIPASDNLESITISIINHLGETITENNFTGPSGTATLTFTPDQNAVTHNEGTKVFQARITGRDVSGAFRSQIIDIPVNDVNSAPSIDADPALSVDQGQAYNAVFTASDDDDEDVGGVLQFSLAVDGVPNALPEWLQFNVDPANQRATLTGTPGNRDVGEITNIVVTVTDGANTPFSLAPFDLTVDNVNDAPTANPDVQVILENASLTAIHVLLNDTDPDRDETRYADGQPVDPNERLGITHIDFVGMATTSFSSQIINFAPANFDSLNDGENSDPIFINYTIRDNAGATSNSTVAVTIQGENDNPTAHGGGVFVEQNQAGGATNEVQLFAANHGDIPAGETPIMIGHDVDAENDAENLDYRVHTLPDAAAGTLFIENAQQARVAAAPNDAIPPGHVLVFVPAIGASGTAAFEFSVNDLHGGQALALVTFSIGSPPWFHPVNFAAQSIGNIDAFDYRVSIVGALLEDALTGTFKDTDITDGIVTLTPEFYLSKGNGGLRPGVYDFSSTYFSPATGVFETGPSGAFTVDPYGVPDDIDDFVVLEGNESERDRIFNFTPGNASGYILRIEKRNADGVMEIVSEEVIQFRRRSADGVAEAIPYNQPISITRFFQDSGEFQASVRGFNPLMPADDMDALAEDKFTAPIAFEISDEVPIPNVKPPVPIELTSQVLGELGEQTVRLSWFATTTTFRVTVSSVTTGEVVFSPFEQVVTGTSIELPGMLEPDLYRWSVLAFNGAQFSKWATFKTFEIESELEDPTPSVLASLTATSANVDADTADVTIVATVTPNPARPVDSVFIVLSDGRGDRQELSIDNSVGGAGVEFRMVINLERGKTYYFKGQAVNAEGISGAFIDGDTNPQANGNQPIVLRKDTDPTITNVIPNADTNVTILVDIDGVIDVQIYNSSNGSLIKITGTVVGGRLVVNHSTDLAVANVGTTYYVRIRRHGDTVSSAGNWTDFFEYNLPE